MKRIIFFIFLLVGVSGIGIADSKTEKNTTSQNNNISKTPVKMLYGYWKIINYKWSGIASSEEKRPQRHIGKVLFFAPKHAKLLDSDGACKSPKYTHSKEDAEMYLLTGCRAGSEDLGISGDIDVFDIECNGEKNKPGTGIIVDMLLITKNRAIYKTEGPFYYLQKVKGKEVGSNRLK